MINALLIVAAAGIGFGGSPWAAVSICGALIVVLGIPGRGALLRRYAGEPKTDIVLVMLFQVSAAIAGALAAAWAGYGMRYILSYLLLR